VTRFINDAIIGGGAINNQCTAFGQLRSLQAHGAYDSNLGQPVYSNGLQWVAATALTK